MDGNSWFRGSWFEVPRQCLLRMPGATGPDADFYRTLTIVEYGNPEQKKAARSGAAAQPAPAKPKESAQEPPKESAEWKESEYFRKLQMRETGEGYMPTGGNLSKLTVPPPSAVPFKETGTELKTESGAMVELTEIAKGAYDKGVEMVADFIPDKLKDMGKEIGDSLTDNQFSKHEETYEAMKEGVGGTMGVIGEGCQMVISESTNSEGYFNNVFNNGIGWMKTAFDRAKEHSTE
jgi:hypothetical protein